MNLKRVKLDLMLSLDKLLNGNLCSKQFKTALERSKGKVGIDLGANFGVYTELLAQHCDFVHAFEPEPNVVKKLKKTLADYKNVQIHEVAACTKDCKIKLFHRNEFNKHTLEGCQGSSTFSQKNNVNPEDYIFAQGINFLEFLENLDCEVGIIKMDIEGGEVDLLELMLERDDLLEKIDFIFVETHEKKIPNQLKRVRSLRAKVLKLKRPRINLYWD